MQRVTTCDVGMHSLYNVCLFVYLRKSPLGKLPNNGRSQHIKHQSMYMCIWGLLGCIRLSTDMENLMQPHMYEIEHIL